MGQETEPLYGERKATTTWTVRIVGFCVTLYAAVTVILCVVFGITRDPANYALGALILFMWLYLVFFYWWRSQGGLETRWNYLLVAYVFLLVFAASMCYVYILRKPCHKPPPLPCTGSQDLWWAGGNTCFVNGTSCGLNNCVRLMDGGTSQCCINNTVTRRALATDLEKELLERLVVRPEILPLASTDIAGLSLATSDTAPATTPGQAK